MGSSTIQRVISGNQTELGADWVKELTLSGLKRDDRMTERELKQQCQEVLQLMQSILSQSDNTDLRSKAWEPLREVLTELSRTRATQGFSPSETAGFVFSLKRPLFERIKASADAATLADEFWKATQLIDGLAMLTIEAYQKGREEVIARQQEEMLELSTPVVTLWEGILALPMIGTLDSARTQVVMESLLTRIAESGSGIAIIDITGVPTVDTLVAQHLIKTVTAARLMGAECIISGIRPQIAQTIVHLGVDLSNVTTKASISDAFAVALKKCRLSVRSIDDHSSK